MVRGPQHAGIIAVGCRVNRCLHTIFLEVIGQLVEERLAFCNTATNKHRLRVKHANQVIEAGGQIVIKTVNHLLRRLIAVIKCIEHIFAGHLVRRDFHRARVILPQRGHGATLAHGVRFNIAVGGTRGEQAAKLTGAITSAADQRTVTKGGAAEAGADGQHQEIIKFFRLA